ncbi:unnamed protein product [Rangifer tarandus platyrhynchus]|uniref:Uncharacterized protein n=1 Tax=Rangifer tarandus platyrhynchus TaxID=3082113 RepID=A0AC59YKX6_RANTA
MVLEKNQSLSQPFGLRLLWEQLGVTERQPELCSQAPRADEVIQTLPKVLKAWGEGGVEGPVQSQESCVNQELGTGNKCFLSETLSLGAVSAAEPRPF